MVPGAARRRLGRGSRHRPANCGAIPAALSPGNLWLLCEATILPCQPLYCDSRRGSRRILCGNIKSTSLGAVRDAGRNDFLHTEKEQVMRNLILAAQAAAPTVAGSFAATGTFNSCECKQESWHLSSACARLRPRLLRHGHPRW